MLNELGSLLSRGNCLVSNLTVCHALGGNWARKTRHVLARKENGLKRVVTFVMNFVIMVEVMVGWEGLEIVVSWRLAFCV